MNLEEAKEVLRKCIGEIQTRMVLNMPKFLVKVCIKIQFIILFSHVIPL